MVMKIENYEGAAETFNFPHNSTVFDDSTSMNHLQKNMPFGNKHIFLSSGSLDPKSLSIQGYFEGSSKDDTFADLLEKASSAKLKKFYFASDKFYLVFMPTFKKTQTGGRTNFLDYIGSMITPIPFIFSDTQKTAVYNNPGWTSGTQTNAGKHKTFVEEIQVTLSGGSAGDTVIIKDANIGGISVTLPTYSLAEVLTIKLVTMVDTKGLSTTEYWYATIGSTEIQRSQASGQFSLDLVLEPTQQIDTLTITGTASFSKIDFFWRDAYIS